MAILSTANSSAPEADEEVVAALVAVQAYLTAEHGTAQHATTDTQHSRWRESAKLVVQNLQPMRPAVSLRWSTIERVRRGAGGGYGVTGL